MKRYVAAFVAAMVITLCVGLVPLAISVNAFTNKNTAPLKDSPSSVNISDPSSGSQDQVAQLQNLVNQYQSREQQYQQREQQYQSRLATAQQQLDQANQNLQQYQQLVIYLQNVGLIRIDQSGRISIP
jgi:peptidoglycan hydrolase CwlO-like protein